jgi:hypothetical protein
MVHLRDPLLPMEEYGAFDTDLWEKGDNYDEVEALEGDGRVSVTRGRHR